MIVLDTNVLSELFRRSPEPSVRNWLDSQRVTAIRTTSVTAAELLHGVSRLPAGRRRTDLADAVHAMLHEDLRGRIEPFDTAAAEQYAKVVCDREAVGRPVTVPDAQIAAICRARGAVLATRNTKDFLHTGVELIDPWAHPAGA